jgi:hypothetical protein
MTFAILVAVAMQASQPYLHPYLPGWLPKKMVADVYATLLATIAATGGVLIGLYYAATTAVGGAFYSRMPNNIRNLLVAERVGNVYMRSLAFLTFLCVILLAFRAIGYSPIESALVIAPIGAGIAIIAFVQVGARVFDFFDPTVLSAEMFGVLQKSCRQMQPGGYRWLDASFQAHAHRKAADAIAALSDVAKVASSESHLTGVTYPNLCKALVSFLIAYEPSKKLIPTESRWYERAITYPDVYRSSDSTISLGFGTRITPEEKSKLRWIEERIAPIAYDCIKKSINAGQFAQAAEIIQYFNEYVKCLAEEHDIASAFAVVRDIADATLAPLSKQDPAKHEVVALFDLIASLPADAFLAYARRLRTYDRSQIAKAVADVDWLTKSSIYRTGLPAHLLTQLEYLQPRVEFEFQSEGRRISPAWYLEELIVKPACENAKICNVNFMNANALFDALQTAAKEAKSQWAYAAILDRELEYWNKLNYQLHVITAHWKALNDGRKIDGLPWPQFSFDDFEKRRDERIDQLVGLVSAHVTDLVEVERPPGIPDFLGQFLHSTGESFISAITSNKTELASKLFPSLFYTSLRQFERLRSGIDLSDWRGERDLKIAVAPLIDLMDLSGYAILMGELFENEDLSKAVRFSWHEYLDGKLTGPDFSPVAFLIGAISIVEGAFELPHRSQIRFSWGRAVQAELERVPSKQEYFRGGFGGSRAVVIHPSALVRVYAGRGMTSSLDGIDALLESMFRGRPEFDDEKLSYRRRELSEALRRDRRTAQGVDPGDVGNDD